jgi:hypothetical protein
VAYYFFGPLLVKHKMENGMSDLVSDLQIELEGLKYEIQVAKSRLPDYSNRHFNTPKENALIYCLRRAVELSEGCFICAKANLLAPLYVQTRSLIESLVWACWITKSDENALTFIKATKNELKRIARKNLNTGHGRVFDMITNEDKTQELLNSDWVKDIQTRSSIEGVAKDVGLGNLYTQVYGFMSIPAHGFMLETDADLKDDMVGILAVANVLIESINLVVKNWITNRKQTPVQDIYDILQ